jgi:DNA-binding transcriptional LysR family regulator
MNLGLAFVPFMCVQDEVARGELVVTPVEGFRHERQLWAVRRRTDAHSHAAQAFMGIVTAMSDKLLRAPSLTGAAESDLDQTAVGDSVN